MSAPRALLVFGAGALARETLELVRALDSVEPCWRVAGLLDDNPATHGRRVHGIEVLGPSELVHEHADALVCLAVALPDDPLRRLRVVERLGLAAERYATSCTPRP